MAPTLEPRSSFKSEKYIPETKNDITKTNNKKSAQNVQEEKNQSSSTPATGFHQKPPNSPLTAPPEYSDPDMPADPKAFKAAMIKVIFPFI
ncbi:hypothetical protein AbraIFM66951_006326 [Aspergillus brasiliensis]|uniref:Uncharacterized protein n=1 Tax=Aspergillus brasiliensis TaxID=319629 RepID=A0A9W6DIN3_9EURO|nr:hypothetical protein AbraCBS73388_004219 [Aspergillus brasiliensis]GKZ40794.1 hypothetical protein AbraIFM66951_006326 [Aspergillus brasiliensis]